MSIIKYKQLYTYKSNKKEANEIRPPLSPYLYYCYSASLANSSKLDFSVFTVAVLSMFKFPAGSGVVARRKRGLAAGAGASAASGNPAGHRC